MDRFNNALRAVALVLLIALNAAKLRNELRAAVKPNPLLRSPGDLDGSTSTDAFERAAERAARGGQL